MVDGNSTTRWVSLSFDAQLILVDLQKSIHVDKIVIAWGVNYATTYRIGISRDSVAWSLLRTISAGAGGTEASENLSGQGRYLKILLDKRAFQGSGYSISELEVYGIPENTTAVVRATKEIPGDYFLYQNYPNPFNPSTSIQFALPVRSRVYLDVYDMLGRKVTELVNDVRDAGLYLVSWSPTMASGLYFCRMETTSVENSAVHFLTTRKVLLLR